jgi:transcription initiation factor TFIIIB Brf1 subunit/transcription initiation factor TFIIB
MEKRRINEKIPKVHIRDKIFESALNRLKKEGSGFKLPKLIQEEAEGVYEKAKLLEPLRKTDPNELVATALYVTARKYGQPVSFYDLCRALKVKASHAARLYRYTREKLNIKELVTPELLVYKFALEENLSEEVAMNAIKILQDDSFRKLTKDLGPRTTAAIALRLSDKIDH